MTAARPKRRAAVSLETVNPRPSLDLTLRLSASAADTEKASTEMLGAARQLTQRTEAMSENIRRFLAELTAA